MQSARSPASPIKHLPMASKVRGFTLVELMVTIAVAAILMAIATPSFTSLINSNRLTSSSNEMVAVIQIARMEAVRLNTTVGVCGGCNGAGSLVAYLDANSNEAFDVGETIVREATVNPAVQLTVGDAFVFRPDGFGREGAGDELANTSYQFCIPTTRPAENIRRVHIASGSRVSTESSAGNGVC